jgi:conserved hypothetical protein
MKDIMTSVRKWSRTLHRDLSYVFSGALLVYAMSGFMLNHKNDFNSNYKIEQHRYTIAELPETVDDAYARSLLEQWGEADNFTAVYDFDAESFKVFIRGGSSLLVNRNTGEAIYESIKKRPVISAINRLHYNPSRYWTWFSDIFLLSLVVIILTGLVMVKGKHGLWGRGGIELLIGIAIPILFMVL